MSDAELRAAAHDMRYYAQASRAAYAHYLAMVAECDKATDRYERLLKGETHEPGSDGPARAASETT